MRTTVTLDPDTELLVKKRMHERGIGFKEALNDLIRNGAVGAKAPKVKTPSFDMGIPRVDLTNALRVAADMEDEYLVDKMRRGA